MRKTTYGLSYQDKIVIEERNRRIALWAADKMMLNEHDTSEFIAEVLQATKYLREGELIEYLWEKLRPAKMVAGVNIISDALEKHHYIAHVWLKSTFNDTDRNATKE